MYRETHACSRGQITDGSGKRAYAYTVKDLEQSQFFDNGLSNDTVPYDNNRIVVASLDHTDRVPTP